VQDGAPQAVGVSLRSLHGSAHNLLSVREVAARLNVSTAMVYKLCNRGQLPHLRVSNAIRIPPADLAEFILDPQQSRIVELRYFGGLTIDETADVLAISAATVKREWSTAKAWLHCEMSRTATSVK